MAEKKRQNQSKSRLHPNNKHQGRYDLEALILCHPPLKAHVKVNEYGNESIDFADPLAVKMLNTALLKKHYKVDYWDIPKEYLCPPIPGRADYLLYVADLLAERNNHTIPKGKQIKVLDIGTGANLIYPIIGHQEFGWSFVASDVDKNSINAAQNIIFKNPSFADDIELRRQKFSQNTFRGIIKENERFDLVVCNPPFHASAKEAQAGSQRKVSNLSKGKKIEAPLNFGGQSHELWCQGGEEFFLKNMAEESKDFQKSVLWFSSLVSKEERVKKVIATLKKFKPKQIKVVPMGTGNKVSRFIAWTYLSADEQKEWMHSRW